jgi:hypothetical protein
LVNQLQKEVAAFDSETKNTKEELTKAINKEAEINK